MSLRLGVEERLRLVLTVQVDEQAADVREHASGDGRTVHPSPRAAAGVHLSPEHHGVVLDVDTALVEHRCRGRMANDVEHALHHRAIGARANQVATSALAEEQTKCPDDDGLSGTGLAGEHVEARLERQRQRLDDRKILDPKLGEHQGIWSRSARPPQPSLRVSTEKNVEPGKRTMSAWRSARRTTSVSP